MIGRTRAELEAGQIRWDQIAPDGMNDADRQAIAEIGRTGRCEPYEREFTRPDGTKIYTLVGASLLPNSSQEGVAFVVDITDRKRAEQALQESESRLQSRTQELEQITATLKEIDRRKDEFLAMLAHELRNPLAPILMATELMKSVAPDDFEFAKESWQVVERHAQQMQRLLNDLLDVSRFTRGKVQLRRQVVELSTVVRSAEEESRPLVHEKRHSLSLALPPEPIYLDADPARLTQVFANILNNAAKYTPAGGAISIDVAREGGDAVVRIRDSGIGLEPGMEKDVFGLFVQASRSIDRSQGGLGIGLTLAKSLVEMHGGTVSAESEGRGKGSVFIVRLPVLRRTNLPDSPRAPDLHSSEALAPMRHRRVLIVDDNVDAARGLRTFMERQGHTVEVAYNGLLGLAKAEEFLPEVALLDIGLPEMDGYELARRLRLHSDLQDALLIAVTGYGQEVDNLRALEAGFDYHMVKPVNLDELRMIISRWETQQTSGV
jgi:PAS domain S-box-containing protein